MTGKLTTMASWGMFSTTRVVLLAAITVTGCVVAYAFSHAQERGYAPVSTPSGPIYRMASDASAEEQELAPEGELQPSEGPQLLPPQPYYPESSRRQGGAARLVAGTDESIEVPAAEMARAPRRGGVTSRAAAEATSPSEPAKISPPTTTLPAANAPVRSVLKQRTKPAQVSEAPPTPIPAEEQSVASPPTLGSDGPALENPTTGPSARRSVSRPATGSEPSGRVKRPEASSPSGEVKSIHDLQIVTRNPSLQIEVNGPSSITVGKPGKYIVHVTNDGEITAQDVVLRLAIPSWVTARVTEASKGDAQIQADAQGTPRVVWNLDSVDIRGREQLRLELTAAEGQPFDLAADWVCRPTSAKAQISVRQAQLELSLAGPADMNFGEEKLFILTVTNPGTGDATGVTATVAGSKNGTQQIDIGTILAGEKKEVPVQVVGSEAGEMVLRAVAVGEGQLSAETAGKVLVRRAQLAVRIDGSEMKYAGSEVPYTITVANQGNASADEVVVSASLPAGAKYLGGIEGANPANGTLKWKLGKLAPGAEKTYEIRCILQAEGENRFALQASSTGGAAAADEIVTQVQAVSDLKLVVNDPSGPIPTESDVTYELVVMNRGTRAANQVKIVMQFSEGIEPTKIEGGKGKIVPGQVICDTLPELGAGEQVTLRIVAKAAKTGTLLYRVEVTQTGDEERLVEEGTTKFFAESGRGGAAARTAKKPVPATEGGTIQR